MLSCCDICHVTIVIVSCLVVKDFAQKPGAKVTSNGCSKPDFLTVAGEEGEPC